MSDYIDIKLRSFLQKYLDEHHKNEQELKSLRLCGRSSFSFSPFGGPKNVYIMSNGEESSIMGTRTCKKSFGCPHCTPRIMAKYGTNIACAIEAMKKWYNQQAFMVTFTLPHSNKMSSKMTMQILKDTWRTFSRDLIKINREYTRKDGKVTKYSVHSSPFARFRNELNIDLFIRVFEMTWCKQNGWHYHIHALFWTPKKNWNKILQYEDALNDYWWKCAKRTATKYLNKVNPEDKLNNALKVEQFYTEWRKKPATGPHRSVFISKENGKPIVQNSSHYITGWTGDLELTGEIRSKIASQGHYNVRQLLECAYENRDDPETMNNFLELYVTAVKTIFRQKLIYTSTTKIDGMTFNQIVAKWKLTNDFMEAYKKKCTQEGSKNLPWKVVAWFYEKEWLEICRLEHKTGNPIRAVILQLTTEHPEIFKHNDTDTLIYDYLYATYDLDFYKPKPEWNDETYLLSFFEKKPAA